jgi:hypothetical protein
MDSQERERRKTRAETLERRRALLDTYRPLALQKSLDVRKGRPLSDAHKAKMAATNRGHSHTPRKVELWTVAKDALNGLSANASATKLRVDDWSILSTRRGLGFPKGWPGFYRHGGVLTRGHLKIFGEDCGLTLKEAGAILGVWITGKFRRAPDRPLSSLQGAQRSRHLGRALADKWDEVIDRGCVGKTREFLASEVRDIPWQHSLLASGFLALGGALRSKELAGDETSIMRWVCEKTKIELARRVSPSPMRTMLFFGLPLLEIFKERPQLCGAGKSFQFRRLASQLLARDYRAPALRIDAVVAGSVQPMDPRGMRQLILQSHAPIATRGKRIRRKKAVPESVVFGQIVQGKISRFASGFNVLTKAKKTNPSSVQLWTEYLKTAGFSEQEISPILTSRNSITAAIRWTSAKQGVSLKTGQNSYSSFKNARTSRIK